MPYASIAEAKEAGFPTTADDAEQVIASIIESVSQSDVKLCKCGCGCPTNLIKITSNKHNRKKGEYSDYLPGHNNTGEHYNVGEDNPMYGRLPWNSGTVGVSKGAKKGNTPWNKNLTKEIDARILKYSKTRIEKGLSKGDKNPGYVDGKSYERFPYAWSEWQSISAKIRDRDGHVCQICGKSEEANEKKLSVHHIVPYRLCNCHDEDNLVSVCRECHNIIEPRKLCHIQ